MGPHPSKQIWAIHPGKVEIQQQHIGAGDLSSDPIEQRDDLVAVLGDEHLKFQAMLPERAVDQ